MKTFGFKCEGILKERDYIDGSFKDRYVLAILKDNWDTIKKIERIMDHHVDYEMLHQRRTLAKVFSWVRKLILVFKLKI